MHTRARVSNGDNAPRRVQLADVGERAPPPRVGGRRRGRAPQRGVRVRLSIPHVAGRVGARARGGRAGERRVHEPGELDDVGLLDSEGGHLLSVSSAVLSIFPRNTPLTNSPTAGRDTGK